MSGVPTWVSMLLALLPTVTSVFAAWVSVQIGLTELRDAQRLQEVQWQSAIDKINLLIAHDATKSDAAAKKLLEHEQRLDDYEYYIRHQGAKSK